MSRNINTQVPGTFAHSTRQTLADAGHQVEFIEVPEGHNPSTWRNHFRDVLVSLFGAPDVRPGEA